MNKKKKLIEQYNLLLCYMIGGFTFLIFGMLGFITLALTVVTMMLLEYKGIVDWGKFIPKDG